MSEEGAPSTLPWRSLRPGMTRREAVELITQAGIDPDSWNESGRRLLVYDWEIELTLAEDAEEHVRQLTTDDDTVPGPERRVMGMLFHDAVIALGEDARGAGWRTERPSDPADDDRRTAEQGTPTAEQLIRRGTLWLPQVGLGLEMWDGHVIGLAWRQPEDVPQELQPVTEEHLAISQQPHLDAYLSASEREQARRNAPPDQWQPVSRALTVLLVAVLGYLGVLSWQEKQTWQAAARLPAETLSIAPSRRNRHQSTYTLAYTDPAGQRRTAKLEGVEFYIAPRAVGETTQICLVPGDPPRVKGPFHAADAAFLAYAPKFIVAVFGYGVLWGVLAVLARRPRQPT